MEAIDIQRRRQAWSSYWAAGGLHSCIGGLVEDPDGAIAGFWEECFAGLRDDDRVLDLATGNGALPRFLRDRVRRRLRVDAVDLADLAPGWRAADAQDGITFHSGVRMEELPFDDGAFDLVVSQFGLEYARWPDAVDEASRVCAATGRLAFVMHHAGSLVIRLGRAEVLQQDFLLAEGGLLDVAEAFLPHLAQVQSGVPPDESANRARFAYNEVMARIGGRIEADPTMHLLVEAREQVHGIVGGRFAADAGARSAQLAAYKQAVADASVRSRELLACALDDARATALADSLRSERCVDDVRLRVLRQGKDIVAWGITIG